MATAEAVYDPSIGGNTPPVTIDGTGLTTTVPLTIKNADPGSGIELQVTGTARTGVVLKDSGGTARSAFGYSVSSNDWFTGASAGDTVITWDSGHLLRFGVHGGARAYASLNPTTGTAWSIADASSSVTSRAADSQASQARTLHSNAAGKSVSMNAYGSSNTVCGITASDITSVETTGTVNSLIIFTASAADVIFGSNSVETFRIDNANNQMKFPAASIAANGTGTVTTGNLAPGSTAVTVQEWLSVRTAGGLRRIALYG